MDPCSIALFTGDDYELRNYLNDDNIMEIRIKFKTSTITTIEYLISALANSKKESFFTKRIVYTHLQVILNSDKFFQYSNISKVVLIKTLIGIYQFMNGDISNNQLYEKFFKLDKQVSSSLKLSSAEPITSAELTLIFGIKNGRRIYNLNQKINYLQHFASKERMRIKFKDILKMYEEDASSLEENLDMYEQIYDIVNPRREDESDRESIASSVFWRELANDLLEPTPTRRVQPKRKCKRGGIRRKQIKKTLENYQNIYSHDKQNINYYYQLVDKLSNL